MYKVITFLKAITLKTFYNSISLKTWEAIAPAGRKAHNSVQDDGSSSVVPGHPQTTLTPHYKGTRLFSLQVFKDTKDALKALKCQQRLISFRHRTKCRYVQSSCYEKLSWCNVKDDALRNPKCTSPQNIYQQHKMWFSALRKTRKIVPSVLSMLHLYLAACRMTFSGCFGFVFPGPDLQKY